MEILWHQREVVLFALSTGLRQANITNLEWSQVDLPRKGAWIHPDQAKARAAIHVSLNSVACAMLKRQQGKHETRVFTYRGKPVKWVNTKAWREALQRAGIAKVFRWHSLRHAWASWLAQSGTPCCRKWAAESHRRWYGVTLISRQRSSLARPIPSHGFFVAQI